MANESRQKARSWQAVVFGSSQFVVLSVLLLMALQPEFKGGDMIVVILASSMLLQIAALFGDMAMLRQSVAEPPSLPARDLAFLRISLMVMVLLIVCYFLGVYAGFVFFLFAYWRQVALFSPLLSLTLAVLAGLALPIVFGVLVNISMWPGTIAELVPGYLGGAISPPF